MKKTKENLLKIEYDRLMTELRVWHILVECPGNASPADRGGMGTATKAGSGSSKESRLKSSPGASDDPP